MAPAPSAPLNAVPKSLPQQHAACEQGTAGIDTILTIRKPHHIVIRPELHSSIINTIRVAYFLLVSHMLVRAAALS